MDTTELIARGDFAHASLRMAIAAYLARFKGQSRIHTESDLRAFLAWCDRQGMDPIEARRPHIELYQRWMQEGVGYKPSTVSRRLSVVAGFYRTCVIDRVLEHSPADYVRRPHVSAESPTLGLNHLQFEAILTASRESSNVNDFALVAMLGLLGLRIFDATGSDIDGVGEVHGHRVLRVHGKGDKIALAPLPPAVGRAIDRAIEDRLAGPILRSRTGSRMDRHCATRRLRALAKAAGLATARMHPHMLRTPSSPPCSTQASASETLNRRPNRSPARRSPNHHAVRPGTQPRPAPQLHPRRLHGVRDAAPSIRSARYTQSGRFLGPFLRYM